jgi:histidyl-tRNA synthetase
MSLEQPLHVGRFGAPGKIVSSVDSVSLEGHNLPPEQTKPASGMRDFLPHDVRLRDRVIASIKRVYELYGFEPLETPALENVDTLMGKYGEEGNQLIFKVLRRGVHAGSGESDLALRYDLTVPLARVMAQYSGVLPKYFKRYQIQPVWRADRPSRGRYREFFQCDVDAMGSASPLVEAELCGAVTTALTELGFDDFAIRINHRQLLTSFLNHVLVPSHRHTEVLIILDKQDKIGEKGVVAELNAIGIEPGTVNRLMNWFGAGYPEDYWTRVEGYLNQLDEQGRAAIANLHEIRRLSEATSAAGRLRLDLSLVRGLSYYTGAIMEIRVPELAGSLGGGGRYDNLIGMFSRNPIPACGFSLGLERILLLMQERTDAKAGEYVNPIDVLLGSTTASTAAIPLRVADELRAKGLRVEVFPEVAKATKIRKYAFDRCALMVAIIDEHPEVFSVRRLISEANAAVMTREALVLLLPDQIRAIRGAPRVGHAQGENESRG